MRREKYDHGKGSRESISGRELAEAEIVASREK